LRPTQTILPEGVIGRAGFTASTASLADPGALAAAAFTAASAPGPAATSDLRSAGTSAAPDRSMTVLPSTSPRAAPFPFSNIMSFMSRLLASRSRLDRLPQPSAAGGTGRSVPSACLQPALARPFLPRDCPAKAAGASSPLRREEPASDNVVPAPRAPVRAAEGTGRDPCTSRHSVLGSGLRRNDVGGNDGAIRNVISAQAGIYAPLHRSLLASCARPVGRAGQNLAGRLVEQVDPLRVHALDQADFPESLPLLDLLFAADGGRHGLVHLVVDEAVHAVALGEPLDQTLLVLHHAIEQIAGDADVERAVTSAGKYVDARGLGDASEHGQTAQCIGTYSYAAQCTGFRPAPE